MRCLIQGRVVQAAGASSLISQRLLAGGKNAEHLVEPSPFKEAAEIVTDSKEDKIAAVGFDPLHGLEQERDAPAIDVVHLVEVDENSAFVNLGGQSYHVARSLARQPSFGIHY
jgi:hypothetical protein